MMDVIAIFSVSVDPNWKGRSPDLGGDIRGGVKRGEMGKKYEEANLTKLISIFLALKAVQIHMPNGNFLEPKELQLH